MRSVVRAHLSPPARKAGQSNIKKAGTKLSPYPSMKCSALTVSPLPEGSACTRVSIVCRAFSNFISRWRGFTLKGALAQLGAHNTGSVGVRGSSPLCSTKTTKPPFSGGFSDIERIKDRASGFFLSSKQIPHPEAAFPSFSDVCMPLFRLWDRAICRQRQNHSRTVRSAFPQTNMRLL